MSSDLVEALLISIAGSGFPLAFGISCLMLL